MGQHSVVKSVRGMKWAGSVLGLVAVAASIAACGGGDESGEPGKPITIGIIADRTGAAQTIGDQFINGSKAAAELFGPINGRPVRFVVEDGGNFNAATTSANVIKLKSRHKAVAVLGFASSECQGATSVAERVQIPMIGNSCSIQDLVGKSCNEWFINGGPSPAMAAKTMAVSAQRQFPDLIGKPWVVLGDDPGWSRSVASYWGSVPGAERPDVQIAPFGTVDWGPYIEKVKATGAKAVLVAVSWGVQYAAFMRQADAAGLFDEMEVVAPNGFPENSMIDGYGAPANKETVEALKKAAILAQYGGSWTYTQQNKLGKRFNELFYKRFKYAPPTQANIQMANTWLLLSAIKKVGTEPRKLMNELATGSFSTPYWTEPLKVQPDGRQLMVPSFATKLERLSKPEYGVDYANEVMFVVPPSQTVESAKAYGCSLPSS
jgi:branched-chain amino acid transport system substrate-binding protein